MKRTYINPNTTTIAFQASMICAGSPAADSGVNVTGPNVGVGGGATDIGTPD